MSKRPARAVLSEYMGKLRGTETWRVAMGEAPDPERHHLIVLANTKFARSGWPFSVGDGEDFGFGVIDAREPDSVMDWQDVIVRENHVRDDGKVWVWRLQFIEHVTRYDGFMVIHSLHPNGDGGVWLGVANNSTRVALGAHEAWAAWRCREEAASWNP